jgi:hypothetical protein
MIEGRAGAFFCIYWGEVSDDSDGPLEWCRPVPTDQAEQLVVEAPELVLRTEPAHREAFIHLGPGGQTGPTAELRDPCRAETFSAGRSPERPAMEAGLPIGGVDGFRCPHGWNR